jgi:hypothetical protein
MRKVISRDDVVYRDITGFFSLPGKILINTLFDVGYPLNAPLEASCESGGSPQ